ncbi:MAG: patatin-like phospholipase family protein [Desulfobacterales bacterium]|jgi:patatin-like phospholipase/acyl hydrolase
MAGTARILSIDGGGIRGIIPALILQRIEERTGKQISEMFHMIAGTSTGGILASALTTPVMGGKPRPAAEIVDFYRKRGMEIFSSSFWHGFGSLGGMVDEKYEANNLEGILEEYFADTKLSELGQDVMVTSYNIERRQPFFFKSWKARGEKLREGETAEDRNFLMREVARATSAAPTYFEPAYAKNEKGAYFPLIDGGVFANNPTMCALSSARVLYPNKSRYLIVSLGTGETQREIPYEEAKNWGLLGWARPLLYILFDGVSDAVNYQLKQEFRARDYFRFEIALGADPEDENAPNDDMDDARPENIRKLETVADVLMKQEKNGLNRLINQLKEPLGARQDLV